MFDKTQLMRLVDLQTRSYLLLKWLADAVSNGMIQFDSAHDHTTLPESAKTWIQSRYLNIPENARPAESELEPFSQFFSTYLVNSFELIKRPGKQLYSPDNHCFCPMCSWLVDAPNLKTKRVISGHKNRSNKLRRNAIQSLAAHTGTQLEDKWIEDLTGNPEHREDTSLLAYGLDLFGREQGIAEGPAILALWRSFAWTSEGSPKKKTSRCQPI